MPNTNGKTAETAMPTPLLGSDDLLNATEGLRACLDHLYTNVFIADLDLNLV